MAKKPTRTWVMVLSLGIPLVIVVLVAMLASFTALVDVARVNGVVIPWLLPVVVDVGMIGSNLAAMYFRRLGVKGRWVAELIFLSFAAVSVYANITHAWLAADLTQTTLVTAIVIAAIFPLGQLGVTHMVMMLIPDEKERMRLQALKDRDREAHAKEAAPTRQPAAPQQTRAVEAEARLPAPAAHTPLRLVSPPATTASPDQKVVRDLVLDYVQSEGKRPTGALIGEWLGGKSAKTGQRFLTKLEAEGDFDSETVSADSAAHAQILQ
jgi:hypothetical protein